MSGNNAWFDVLVFLTIDELKVLNPAHTIERFEELDEAIEEALLWVEAYQVVVIARGNENEYEHGEHVYTANDL
jgi:hypothetical protein